MVVQGELPCPMPGTEYDGLLIAGYPSPSQHLETCARKWALCNQYPPS